VASSRFDSLDSYICQVTWRCSPSPPASCGFKSFTVSAQGAGIRFSVEGGAGSVLPLF